jgi:gentisate 1,2-dioxygenase
MRLVRHTGVLALILALWSLPPLADAQEAAPAPVRSFTTFDGSLKITPEAVAPALANGEQKTIAANFKIWMISAHTAMETIPAAADENRVVELASGAATTTIGDQTMARTVGDFWVAPAGEKMTVTTDDQAAVLRILSLSAH